MLKRVLSVKLNPHIEILTNASTKYVPDAKGGLKFSGSSIYYFSICLKDILIERYLPTLVRHLKCLNCLAFPRCCLPTRLFSRQNLCGLELFVTLDSLLKRPVYAFMTAGTGMLCDKGTLLNEVNTDNIKHNNMFSLKIWRIAS